MQLEGQPKVLQVGSEEVQARRDHRIWGSSQVLGVPGEKEFKVWVSTVPPAMGPFSKASMSLWWVEVTPQWRRDVPHSTRQGLRPCPP